MGRRRQDSRKKFKMIIIEFAIWDIKLVIMHHGNLCKTIINKYIQSLIC